MFAGAEASLRPLRSGFGRRGRPWNTPSGEVADTEVSAATLTAGIAGRSMAGSMFDDFRRLP